jgi:hypothetical protein
MPLNPLRFETPEAYSSFDFSPLARLGQLLRGQQQQQAMLDALGRTYGNQQPANVSSSTSPESLPSSLPANPSGTVWSAPIPPVGAGGPGSVPTPPVFSAPLGPVDSSKPAEGTDYQRAISRIESGGRYDLRGPVTSSGDRAYGKYQVMGSNIPEWTKDALGRSMTIAEFLADPQAQDAVFNHRFGSYVSKYGPGGAARAWFAGEGGMNNPNARDQLGTSVGSYERQFLKGLGNGD